MPDEKERRDFRGSDRRARSKYAPLSEFDSVQELAALGSVVPLIFCNRDDGKKIGGVRVDSQMLWSKMVNRRTYQEMHALMLFGAGAVAKRPDFEGYAFGDNKMSSYIKAKIGLWFARGGIRTYEPFRVGNQQQYGEGTKDVGNPNTAPFETYWPYDGKTKMVFCGRQRRLRRRSFANTHRYAMVSRLNMHSNGPGRATGIAIERTLSGTQGTSTLLAIRPVKLT